jgi:hemoglobin/transferrin/lactoferrin receptor protein
MRSSNTLLTLAIAASLLSAANIAASAESAAAAPADSAAKQLQKIKVTAEESGKSVAGNTKVVGIQQLEEEQAQNFEDAIRYIPGVSIVDMGRFGDNGFNIRGLESDRVAMTVDGLAFAEAVETTPAYEFFRSGRGNLDIDSLKSIEIVKGADSISAGSGALGGAVMFTTKDPYDYLSADGNDTAFRVKTAYTGSTDETMTSATVANRTGIIESMLVYTLRKGHEAESWYDNSPITTGSGRRTPDPIDRDSDNILAKVDFVLNEAHRLGIVAERARSTNEIDNLSRVGGAGYLTRRADDDNDRDRYGVRYIWNETGTAFDSMEFTADRQKTKSRGLTTILAGSGCPRNVLPCLRSEDRSTDQVLDRAALDFSKAFSSGSVGHSLIYGLAWQQRNVDFVAVDTRYIGTTDATDSVTVDPAQVPKTDVTSLSAYVRDRVYLINDRLTLHAGARYDRTKYSPKQDPQFIDTSGTVRDVDFSAPTWQVGADFKFTPTHSVWAQVGSGFRAPSVAEMFAPTSTSLATEVATGQEATLWSSVANPDLESEKSLNTEIGYRWRTDRFQLGLSVYRDKYTNFIESTAFIRNPTTGYQTCVRGACTVTLGNEYTMPANVGEVTVKGVEVEGRWAITGQWSARLAWAYSKGDKNNGDPLPSIVPATGVVGLRYAAPSRRWTVAANVTHAAAKKIEDAVLTATAANDFFTSLVPDYLSDEYTVVDLFGTLNVTKSLQLSAGVYNAFDEKYYLWPRVRFVNEGTSTLYGYVTGDGIARYSEPGRNVRASLSWQF